MITRKQCCLVTNGSDLTFNFARLYFLHKHSYSIVYLSLSSGKMASNDTHVHGNGPNLHESAARDLKTFTARPLESIYVYDSVNCYPEVMVGIVSFRLPVSSEVSGVIGTAIGHFLRCLKASVDTSHLNIGM